MTRLDARGLSCPEPVIMIKKAMTSKEKAYEMVVNSPNAKENVTRFAENAGYKVVTTEVNGEYTLKMTK